MYDTREPFHYTGKEHLRRFYESCIAHEKEHNAARRLNRCVMPVGLLIAALMIILGIFSYSRLTTIGVFIIFATIIVKIMVMKKKVTYDMDGIR
ncbi:MAG: hypothetical protein PHS74_11860 [Lachnospiraceae bacterium]|nr:hypothetical protein [Lachnospiraceae bacterium]